MYEYKNLFKEKTESELILLYKQFLEAEENGGIPDNELGKIRDEYCSLQTNGILMMILDLTRTVADKWYSEHKADEDIPMSLDDFIDALHENYEDAVARGFDSIVLTIDTDTGNTYYISDTQDGFQCDLVGYYYNDLADIAIRLYGEIQGNVTDIRIE